MDLGKPSSVCCDEYMLVSKIFSKIINIWSAHSKLKSLTSSSTESSHAAHSTHSAHSAEASSAAEKHFEYLIRVNSTSHSSESTSLISIIVNLATVIQIFLLLIGKTTISFGNFFEFSRCFFLLGLWFISIAVRMVFKGECFVRFLDFILACIALNFQYFVIIFLFRLFFLLFCKFDLIFEVIAGINLLNFAVVHNCCSVLASFHVQLCSSHQSSIIIGIQFEWFIQIVQSFKSFLPFYIS